MYFISHLTIYLEIVVAMPLTVFLMLTNKWLVLWKVKKKIYYYLKITEKSNCYIFKLHFFSWWCKNLIYSTSVSDVLMIKTHIDDSKYNIRSITCAEVGASTSMYLEVGIMFKWITLDLQLVSLQLTI